MIVVKTYYNTKADGSQIPDDTPLEDREAVCYGPFETENQAIAWMNSGYPDDDTEIYEQYVTEIA